MSKAEKTKEYIIERAAPIFNKKGYAGTSLSDLIEATGLTKGSIYGNFENKDAVAVAVYKYNVASLNKRIAAALSDKITSHGKLKAFTNYYRSNWKQVFERGGCPLQNASVEADDNIPFLKKHVQQSVKMWTRGIARLIEQGQENGEFKKQCNALKYAYTILGILEGGILLGKIMNDHEVLFNALDRIDKVVTDEIMK